MKISACLFIALIPVSFSACRWNERNDEKNSKVNDATEKTPSSPEGLAPTGEKPGIYGDYSVCIHQCRKGLFGYKWSFIKTGDCASSIYCSYYKYPCDAEHADEKQNGYCSNSDG